MNEVHELELTGCAPEPLMSYLKALGILRLVSEQADSEATACWRSGVLVLWSRLDREALLQFILHEYRPTPVLAPWNAGSGFYKKWDPRFPDAKEKHKPGYDFFMVWDPANGRFKSRKAADALESIENSTNPVFEPYRVAIAVTRGALGDHATRVAVSDFLNEIKDQAQRENWSEKQTKDRVNEYLNAGWLFDTSGTQARIDSAAKDKFVRMMRNSVLNDQALRWLDTALVLLTGLKKNRVEAPLLGSGGNIGNSDFSARFMQLLAEVLPLNDSNDLPPDRSYSFLSVALFGGDVSGLLDYAVDQFNPGIAGGANMGQGTEANPRLNPWDYVLMVEGALLMAGAVTRQLAANRTSSAFPFSVDDTPAGFPSAGVDETRGELWLPLWNRPATLGDIGNLLAEGRAEVGKRRPRDGVEFARAVASLGVDRGIGEFVRLQFQKRFGDNFLATALDRIDVRFQKNVELLNGFDRWLNQYRFACSGEKPKTPPRFLRVLRRIEAAILDYCRYGRNEELQQILIVLGQAERELALRAGNVKQDKNCSPVAGLSTRWLGETYDGSLEFDIALSVAGIHDRTRESKKNIGPIRCNIEPVSVRRTHVKWIIDDEPHERDQQTNRHVVWNSADLSSNMAAVLARRMMDGTRAGCDDLPLESRHGVTLSTVAAFIDRDVDDSRIDELVWGLMLVNCREPFHGKLLRGTPDAVMPREYALLKLLFLPRSLVAEIWDDRVHWRLAKKDERGLRMRPEPRVLPLLRAGRVAEACRIAYQRLRSSGLKPLPAATARGVWRQDDWEPAPSLDAQRLAASLLIPIDRRSVNEIVHLVTRQDEEPDFAYLVTEGADAP